MLKVLKRFSNRIEAEAEKTYLENLWIKTVVDADDKGGLSLPPHSPLGVQLLVHEKDYEKANKN